MTAVPRTRADRLRLLGRLAVASRAAELLRSKEEALERERDRLAGYLTRAREQWAERAREAADLLIRARALGASGELTALARGPATATVAPDWQASMGITYPGDVGCEPGPVPPLTSTAALLPTTQAHQRALAAAAAAGAAELAVARLDAELAQTRRRRRAVEKRLVPDLAEQRHRLELHLDELDREEALRVRLAASLTSGSRP